MVTRACILGYISSHIVLSVDWLVGIPRSQNARLFYRASYQRLADARLLLRMKRTTGAVYLAGYSVECILKALVLSMARGEKEKALLLSFRGQQGHRYGWLKGLYAQLGGPTVPAELAPHFARVNSWATKIRYSPGTIDASSAAAFLESASRIVAWADGRL
jgi:hypothetical protein